jgi:hypothetical protein
MFSTDTLYVGVLVQSRLMIPQVKVRLCTNQSGYLSHAVLNLQAARGGLWGMSLRKVNSPGCSRAPKQSIGHADLGSELFMITNEYSCLVESESSPAILKAMRGTIP